MVSMNSFRSDVLKTASNSISSSIHQCSGRKCPLIHFMEISFCVQSFWRKLDVHILAIHPPYLGKCQACTTVMYVDFNFTRTYAATMTEYRQGIEKLLQQQNWSICSICQCEATYRSKIGIFESSKVMGSNQITR